jgi:hypothetical protein
MSPDIHTTLELYISNLQHLMNLVNSGFDLCFIEKEGIWFVKKTLDREPDEDFCNFLLPPEESSN